MPTHVASKPLVAHSKHERQLWLRGLITIAVLAIVTYLPLWRAGFIWDDDFHMSYAPEQVSLNGLWRIWFQPGFMPQYYPVLDSMLWVEWHLWGMDPLGYHLVNLALHIANAWLVWLVLTELQVPGAFLAAVLFAIHPVEVETVAWISEGKNTLSCLFYLLSGWLYFRFSGIVNADLVISARRRWAHYAGALALFVLALLSKTVACSLPAALLLLIWWKRGRLRLREDILPLIPWLAIGAACGLYTAHVESGNVGASGKTWDMSFVNRCLIAARAIWFYLGKLLLPFRMSFNYERWQIDAHSAIQWSYLAALLIPFAVLILLMRRFGRGPLVAWLFFVGTLFPALGFFNVFLMQYSFVADHFQYHASIGMIALLAAALTVLANYVGWPAYVSKSLAGAWVICLGALAFAHCLTFESSERLWRDAIGKSNTAWMPRTNLAISLVKEIQEDLSQGQLPRAQNKAREAQELFDEAMVLNPTHPSAHVGLANLFMVTARYPDAITEFQRAIDLKPTEFDSHAKFAGALNQLGDYQGARREFERAVELQPRFVQGRIELAKSMVRDGDLAGAERQYREALALNDQSAALHAALGGLLFKTHRTKEAATEMSTAVQLEPESAVYRNNLGIFLEDDGKLGEALAQFEQAVRLHPDFEAAVQSVQRVREKLRNGNPATLR